MSSAPAPDPPEYARAPAAEARTPHHPPGTPRPALRPLRAAAWALLLAAIVGVTAWASYRLYEKAVTPPPLEILSSLPLDLTFTDETSATRPLAHFKGHWTVFDFVFTRCGGQCPLMSQRMQGLQNWLKTSGIESVRLASVTVDPENDSPEVLREYAKRFQADSQRWNFYTAPRPQLERWIKDSFKLGLDVNPNAGSAPAEEPIIHSDRFVLVDPDGLIRGYYTAPDPLALEQLRKQLKYRTRPGAETRPSGI